MDLLRPSRQSQVELFETCEAYAPSVSRLSPEVLSPDPSSEAPTHLEPSFSSAMLLLQQEGRTLSTV